VGAQIPEALARLDELTRRLRSECPWDREQDERSIVPHTVEEAYELADAAAARDDARMLDELGDVLFQVHFLSLLLEERGAGDLARVADHCREKLIRRHPHVFPPGEAVPGLGEGPVEAGDAAQVLRNWDAIKSAEGGREPGLFGEVPENLPALLLARKLQRRAASSGFDVEGSGAALAAASAQIERLEHAPAASGGPQVADPERGELFAAVGDALFALVSVARKLKVDPELALRASAARFRASVEAAEQLAARAGEAWAELGPDAQLAYYAQARLMEEQQ
jgi:MazG family protein